MDASLVEPPAAPAAADAEAAGAATTAAPDPASGETKASWTNGPAANLLAKHALPDTALLGELAPLAAVRFVRLLLTCLVLFTLTRTIVFALDLEHDRTYGIDAFFRYDVNEVILDLMFLFAAGGMWKKPAADQLGFALLASTNAFMMSIMNQIPALQVSFGLYEMHCRWVFATWCFVAFFGCLSAALLRVHFKHFAETPGVARRAGLQLFVMFVMFWVPHLNDGDFHIHHWFYSWFLACQCNFDPWWSRATQAWFLGGYINGIAVYGRDPLLVCEAAFYRAIPGNGNCGFMEMLDRCVLPGTNETVHVTVNTADWWTCTGDYH